MDILNKIREPEKQVVQIDNFDNVETSQFSKGIFVKPNKEELVETPEQIEAREAKKKMTLMERLASMSPDEDAKKAKILLEKENDIQEDRTDEEQNQEISNKNDSLQQTASLEDMLRQIKEKDQREVEKALQQKQTNSNIKRLKMKQLTKLIVKKLKLGVELKWLKKRKRSCR